MIVHTKRLMPLLKPVTAEVGELAEVMVPLPDARVQVPVPMTGTLPLKLVAVEQMVWSLPALAAVGSASTVMITVSFEAGQVPFTMLQTNTFWPMLSPVTDEVAEFTLPNVPLPDASDQVPVPVVGTLAAKADELEQICWLAPAFDTVG